MNKYMEIAKNAAENGINANEGGPFGAVITDKEGNIVATGNNQVLKNNDPTAHAEVMAIRDACKNISSYDLSECELYTSCYPCPMCLAAIIWSNIKKVYYGNTKEDAAEIGFRDDFIYNFISKLSENKIDNNILELKSIDREQTIEEFNKFKKKEDKIVY